MSEQQEQQPEHATDQTDMAPPMSSPSLSEFEATQAREDALRRANQPQSGEAIAGAHGRVEEETRRLSERMTREEQERRKALALSTTAPLIPSPSASRLLPTPMQIHATLVALDGSPFAERALPYAAALAHLTGSALTIGSCIHRAGPITQSAGAPDDLAEAADAQVSQSLLAARAHLNAHGLAAQARVIYAPDVADGLLSLQDELGAEAVAMTTHARTGIERAALGSIADEVARRGKGLTLVIPPGAPDAGLGAVSLARALAPLDGSARSEQSLRVIQPLLQRDTTSDEQAQRWLSKLALLFVAEDRAQIRDAEYYLTELRESLLHGATAPTTITTQVTLGSAPGAIVARAAGDATTPPDARHDLIIMATHGRSGLGRWFYGSVAMYVLAHSAVPVLLVRTDPTNP